MKIVGTLFVGVLVIALSIKAWMYWPFYQVQEAVKLHLGAPSADFWGVTINRGSQAACGYVKARKANGDYALRTHFVLLQGGELRLKPWETGIGTPAEVLEAAQQQLAYVRFVQKNCAGDKP